MSVFNMFRVSSIEINVGEISHAPAPASQPRNRALRLSFSLRGFPIPILPPLFERAALRHFVFRYLSPPFGFRSRFSTFGELCAFAVGSVISIHFTFQFQDLSVSQWYITRLALAYLALSHTSDAALSSFVPRFQRSGDFSLFFASFGVPVCSDVLSNSLCTRLIGFALRDGGFGVVVKRRIFDLFSEFSAWI